MLRQRSTFFPFGKTALHFGALLLVLARAGSAANSCTISSSSITVSGSSPNYSINVGSIDGLGIGTPASNVSVTPLSGGRLWYTDVSITTHYNSTPGTFSMKVGTSYTHSTVQTAYFCDYNGSGTCVSTPSALTASYTTWTTSDTNGGATARLGTWLSPANGAGAFTGADSVTITFQTSSTGGAGTCNLTINLTVQNAVQLTLATSGAGLAFASASDFSATWGNVNGLGVGVSSPGLTANSATGGFVYETPYSLMPVFSSFSGTTCTLKVYVSSNFAHNVLLAMKDTSTSGGPYTTISLTSASPTTITTTATSSSTITRYLGLFVSNQNGASAFTGSDNATLTYQLTAP